MGKNDNYYLNQTLNEANLILDYSKECTIIDLEQNSILLDAIVFRMIQMSEHMDKISEGFKNDHPEIRWVNIKGFRNRLVHDYGGVDLTFVYNAISQDIPQLQQQIRDILK